MAHTLFRVIIILQLNKEKMEQYDFQSIFKAVFQWIFKHRMVGTSRQLVNKKIQFALI